MAKMSVYDMIRAKAKSMGHNAANIPDKVLEGVVQQNERQMNLLGAKLYLENYMIGNVDPSDFARVLAANDQLRYTVSDLCRMKLEPRELDVQRGDGYIDIGAGLKTFWSEMRVPLPSEREAARDLRNIALGVEAGKRTQSRTQTGEILEMPGPEDAEITEKSKRRSIRDVLNDAKQRAASAAIEKLTPIAEGKKEDKKVDESWLETDDGQAYKEAYTRKAAQQVENIVMNIEAGKDMNLPPEERKKAMEAAGVKSDYQEDELERPTEEDMKLTFSQTVEGRKDNDLRSGYTPEELSASTGSQMDALMEQIGRHMGQPAKDREPVKEQDGKQDRKRSRQRDDRFYGVFDGKEVSFKKQWSTHTFTDEEAQKLLNGESVSFEYQKGEETKMASGKLEWQTYDGREFLGFKPDFGKKQEAAPIQEDPDSIFTDRDMDYLNGPSQEEMDDYYARMYDGENPLDELMGENPEEGQPELTAQDLEDLFSDDQNTVKL